MHRCCGVFHPSFFLFPPFCNKNQCDHHKSGWACGFVFIFNWQHTETPLVDCNKFDTRRHLFKFIWNKTFPSNLWAVWVFDVYERRATLIAIEFSRSTSVICHQFAVVKLSNLTRGRVDESSSWGLATIISNADQMKNSWFYIIDGQGEFNDGLAQ